MGRLNLQGKSISAKWISPASISLPSPVDGEGQGVGDSERASIGGRKRGVFSLQFVSSLPPDPPMKIPKPLSQK